MTSSSTTYDYSSRSRAVKAALGEIPFDTLLINGYVLDMATGESRSADIGLIDNLIASVHPRGKYSQATHCHDLQGAYVSPGFIDMHVHLESSHLTPDHYAGIVLKQGTTTIFWDPHELANVLGMAGVKYAINTSQNLPLRVICAAPSSVPSTPGLEMSGAEFAGQEMSTMLSWPGVGGVAEVMDMYGVLQSSDKMVEVLSAGLASGKLIEGHGRGLADERLQAYLAAGITSDHELTSANDLLEKLRAGLTIEIRGSHPYLLEEFVNTIKSLPRLTSQITLCTDDVPPDLLIEKGGLIQLMRLLVSYGLPVIDVLRMATLNASLRLQRNDIGLIAAGRCADLVILDDLTTLSIQAVYANGKQISQQQTLLVEIPPANTSEIPRNTVYLPPTTMDNFRIAIPGLTHGKAQLRIIKSARFTQWSEVIVDVEDGYVKLPEGYSLIYVQHRHGKHPAIPQLSIMEDWGNFNGAIATTYSHDCHNLVVLGNDPENMMIAANALIACGGGMVLSQQGKILQLVEMPIAGLLSEDKPDILAAKFKAIRDLSAGVAEWLPPYRVFKAIEGTCLACNAGPHLTDLGLTDGTTREIINPLINCWPT